MKLNEFEALVLTAVVIAGAEACAVPIFEEIGRLLPLKKEPSLGKMYIALDHLEQSGFIHSWYSKPDEELNSRSRRYFEITGAGRGALKESVEHSASGLSLSGTMLMERP
jgi:PadR family transcriptional regulator PadR